MNHLWFKATHIAVILILLMAFLGQPTHSIVHWMISALFTSLFIALPILVNALISFNMKGIWSQLILFVATLGLGIWAFHAFDNVKQAYTDEKLVWLLLSNAMHTAPFFVLTWLVCLGIESLTRRRMRLHN